jgi:putative oxidoreductase
MKDKVINILSSLPVQVLCRFILGGLFIYAGIHKVADPHGFAKIVYNYQLLPDILVTTLAVVMPWVEIIAGFFLVAGIFERTSAVVLTSLLLIFSIAITINLIRGLNFDCGCFSTVVTESGSDTVGLLIRDVLMLIPGFLIILFHQGIPSTVVNEKTSS